MLTMAPGITNSKSKKLKIIKSERAVARREVKAATVRLMTVKARMTMTATVTTTVRAVIVTVTAVT